MFRECRGALRLDEVVRLSHPKSILAAVTAWLLRATLAQDTTRELNALEQSAAIPPEPPTPPPEPIGGATTRDDDARAQPRYGASRGSSTTNSAPCPNSLSTMMRPPCASATPRAMKSPIPSPVNSAAAAARSNLWKI